MKTKEELIEEVESLVSALQQAELDLKNEQKVVENLSKEISRLNNEVSDLEEKIEQQPDTSNLVDQMKHELYVEHFHKFSLEQFEAFLKTNK